MGVKVEPFQVQRLSPRSPIASQTFSSYEDFSEWREAKAAEYQRAMKHEGELPLTSQLGIKRLWQLDELARRHFKSVN